MTEIINLSNDTNILLECMEVSTQKHTVKIKHDLFVRGVKIDSYIKDFYFEQNEQKNRTVNILDVDFDIKYNLIGQGKGQYKQFYIKRGIK